MLLLKILFWGCLLLVFYTYVGYGLVLYIWLKVKSLFGKQQGGIAPAEGEKWPPVTLVIAAYNEADILAEKLENCKELDYPETKLHFLFVTDGSNDGSPDFLRKQEWIQTLHQPERNGKIAAINRAMQVVHTPITVFTDANTFLNPMAIRELVSNLEDPTFGAVAGEKYIRTRPGGAASGAGEGLYWKYESALKRMDAELYSVVGAAGELYAIRTALYQEFAPDTILDDFMQTLLIAKAGYRVAYNPNARAEEYPSANLEEELKRKIRICAGGIQSILRLIPLLNLFKYGLLSFQYISHRVLRWTLAPVALILLLVSNIWLAAEEGMIYQLLMVGQTAFYTLALAGYLLRGKEVKVPGFFVPLYFCMMNYSVFAGMRRYFLRTQSVNWEKAKRADQVPASLLSNQ